MRTIALEFSEGNSGVAVSPDGRRLFVCNRRTRQVYVHSLPDCGAVMSFGEAGTGTGQFCDPMAICVTHTGTLLVAESRNRRVQEVTCVGDHVRYVGVGVFTSEVTCVAAAGDGIAVGTSTGTVHLFNYVSGALLRSFGAGEGLGYCGGLTFGPDNRHITVSDTKNGRLAVYFVTGAFLRFDGEGALTYPCGVAYTAGGEPVVADSRANRVSVLTQDGGAAVVSPTPPTPPFQFPHALCVHNGVLFVLSSAGGRLHALT